MENDYRTETILVEPSILRFRMAIRTVGAFSGARNQRCITLSQKLSDLSLRNLLPVRHPDDRAIEGGPEGSKPDGQAGRALKSG